MNPEIIDLSMDISWNLHRLLANKHSEYADVKHNHDTKYSDITHLHDDKYSNLTHHHDEKYSQLQHDHDTKYATKVHSHSDYVDLTSAQTVSNKTLTESTQFIDGKFKVGSSTITIPNITSELVNLVSQQTLLNKTLTNPIIFSPHIHRVTDRRDDWFNLTYFDADRTQRHHYFLGTMRYFFFRGIFSNKTQVKSPMEWIDMFDITSFDRSCHHAIYAGRGYLTGHYPRSNSNLPIEIDTTGRVLIGINFVAGLGDYMLAMCFYYHHYATD